MTGLCYLSDSYNLIYDYLLLIIMITCLSSTIIKYTFRYYFIRNKTVQVLYYVSNFVILIIFVKLYYLL